MVLVHVTQEVTLIQNSSHARNAMNLVKLAKERISARLVLLALSLVSLYASNAPVTSIFWAINA